jgi:hypothetical protein
MAVNNLVSRAVVAGDSSRRIGDRCGTTGTAHMEQLQDSVWEEGRKEGCNSSESLEGEMVDGCEMTVNTPKSAWEGHSKPDCSTGFLEKVSLVFGCRAPEMS